MLALAKIELTIPWAVDINFVWVVKLAFVSARRAGDQRNARTLWDRDPMHFEGSAGSSPLKLRGGVESQQFFNGLRDQLRFIPNSLPEGWFSREVDQCVPDQLCGGFCTGLAEKCDETNDLCVSQMLGLAIGVLVLRLRKDRHEIVLRVSASLLENFTHEIARLDASL